MRWLGTVLIVTFVLGLVGALHGYLWLRLVRDPGLGVAATRLLTALLIGLGLSLPAAFTLSRTLPPDRGELLLPVLFAWFGLFFWLVLGSAVSDLGTLLWRGIARAVGSPLTAQHRLWLARSSAGTLVLLTAIGTVVAVRVALGPVVVREVAVTLRRLPNEMAGFKLVQLSDLHLGPTLREGFVRRVVEQVNALEPSAIVITGDLVDGPVEKLREIVSPLAELRARHGVFFVTGNHEYYAGAEPWCVELERLGIRVLRNEHVPIETEGEGFLLAGVYDWDAARHPEAGHRMDLAAALARRDSTREVILLAHQPRVALEARHHDVGLVLSGHTHGGQIWPWKHFVRLQQPVVHGLWRLVDSTRGVDFVPVTPGNTGSGTQLHVSAGTGFWGPPLRLGTRPEIAVLRLTPPAITR